MKILAIDAATEACSVALQIDNETISRFEVAPQQHSQKLLPMVDQVLAEASVSLNGLDYIAYGQGPGSFTGVRIGVAITQGLAFGAELPVVGISNLAAMAQQAITENNASNVVAAIDARMSEIYLGNFTNINGLAELVGSETVIKPELAQRLPDFSMDNCYAVGTGWQTYEQVLTPIYDATRSNIDLPNAIHMLPLAHNAISRGLATSAEFAQPNYVRDEVSWKKLPGR